ncbi:TRAP transporter small permease [Microvirga sp. GCM10011540]|uniref:TRAP transporter small permease n=1 Tax=Microvirga sp. GCM10011540 TaxID=3317338 RepID=UPI00360FA6D7
MLRIIALWEGLAAYIVLPLLALVVTADVALRYLFNAPLVWGTDVKELILLIVVTAGFAGVSLAGEHIRVTLVEERMGARVSITFIVIRHALTAIAMGVIAYALIQLTLDMAAYSERAEMIAIPYWPFAALMALSAAMSAVVEIVKMFRAPAEARQ